MVFDVFLLFCMIFCHIVDDYYLQGWLASAKQRQWWKENAPDKLYRNDYLMALSMHGFSWTFSIMLIPTLLNLSTINLWLYVTLFFTNWLLHIWIDDMKANDKTINLVEDQALHLLQIFITWALFIL